MTSDPAAHSLAVALKCSGGAGVGGKEAEHPAAMAGHFVLARHGSNAGAGSSNPELRLNLVRVPSCVLGFCHDGVLS